MQRILVFIFCLSINIIWSQFKFSGFVDQESISNPIYLSIVEDYRKLSGIYTDQIIAKATANTDGYFEFSGNYLEGKNRIYRIHIDHCKDGESSINHFNGNCKDSEYILFIAKNTDVLNLPFSFGKQMFCEVESNNPKANSFIKIDSIKEIMRYDYAKINSKASKKLNDKKWFKTLQNFGTQLNEPLVELYIYAYLSDRSGDLHSYYVEDLNTCDYYENLKQNLIKNYPNLNLTQQYIKELKADRFMIQPQKNNQKEGIYYLIMAVTAISIGLNIFFFLKIKKQKNKKNILAQLSKQEQVVLNEILQNKSNKEIAESLFLSVSTIKTHINNIYKKLNVQSREEAKKLFYRYLKN